MCVFLVNYFHLASSYSSWRGCYECDSSQVYILYLRLWRASCRWNRYHTVDLCHSLGCAATVRYRYTTAFLPRSKEFKETSKTIFVSSLWRCRYTTDRFLLLIYRDWLLCFIRRSSKVSEHGIKSLQRTRERNVWRHGGSRDVTLQCHLPIHYYNITRIARQTGRQMSTYRLFTNHDLLDTRLHFTYCPDTLQ